MTLFCLGISSNTFGQTSTEGAKAKRAPLIDDQFREQGIVGSLSVAADGQAVAFGVHRTIEADPAKALSRREDRTDIFVQLRSGEKVRAVTDGASDGSGWWRPRWSPDGAKLLMLSTRGGQVTPWIWERDSARLQQLMTVGLDEDDLNGGCQWVDNQRLMCLALATDEEVRFTNPTCPGYQLAQQGWAKAARGELTASVLSTETYFGTTRRLVLLDLTRPGHRVLAQSSGAAMRSTWWVSTATNAVVYVKPLVSPYPRMEQSMMGYPGPLAIVTLDGRPLRLSTPLPANVISTTVTLSPDKTEVAFFAYGGEVVHPDRLYGVERAKDVVHPRPSTEDNPARLWVVNLNSGRVDEVATGDVDLGRDVLPPSFQWLASGEFLFNRPRLSARAQVRTPAKAEWLILNRQGKARTLTLEEGKTGTPYVVNRGRTLLVHVGQELLRIDVATGTSRSLTKELEAPVVSLKALDTPSGEHLLVRTGKPSGATWGSPDFVKHIGLFSGTAIPGTANRLLDLDSGQLAELPAQPNPTASLSTISTVGRQITAWYTADDPAGTFAWRTVAAQPAETLVTLNLSRREIQRFEERVLDYTSANGEPLKALLVLPANYSPNRRYPVVVDSDVGYSQHSAPTMYDLEWRKANASAGLDASTFAGAGYVYVFASAPTDAMDSSVGRANMLTWHLGVLPAVDKLIAMGVADPDRIVLNGSSSFGYGVYGIVTQTSRFKAAVAMAGWVDLQSLSVSVTTCTRYMSEPFGGTTGPLLSRRQSSFWRDSELFHRNSPLSYVDRVQTPLLIVHNDGDFLPIEQAEMFYAALVAQRKPAMFVRYWGEGHGQRLPANVHDAYQRILAWFDRYTDVLRDDTGAMVFEGDRAKSRGAAPPLSPEAFARFQPFSSAVRSASQQAARPE